MKKLRFIILCLAVSICCGVAGQAKRPKLMVVPSDAWCKEHGYTQIFENQGSAEEISDYKAALQGDKNLNNVISKINILMRFYSSILLS